jgi:hypothetical protein
VSAVARTLLLKLLAQAERGGRATLPINARSAKDYFAVADLAGRDRIHAALANAEMADAVVLDWGTGAAAQDLLRLRLKDADRLAAWLGVPRAASHAGSIEANLSPLLAGFPEWLREAYDEALARWNKGLAAFRVPVDDVTGAINLFRVALAVNDGEQNDLDLRRFSARLLGDSKAVEGMLGKLAELLRRNPEWSQLEENAELFRALGLEKFPPPLLVKGPLRIAYGESDWDISPLRPFVGLSPDQVHDLGAVRPAPYLLTVENLASFQRHAREIEDEGIVIYTAGFPAPSLIQLLQRLDRRLPLACPFWHWGDRDIGGLRILAKLSTSLSVHSVQPHLMEHRRQAESPFTKSDQQKLGRYAGETGSAGRLASTWLDMQAGPMEQETLDPQAPPALVES